MRMAECHPDRKHLAKGFCNACYKQVTYEKRKAWSRDYYAENRDAILSKQEKYRNDNRDWINEKQRRDIPSRVYGLSDEQYRQMIDDQRGLCAICERVPAKRGRKHRLFVIDHDHTTEQVRGLLCDSCNLAIGHLDEDIERLYAVIEYLTYWKEKQGDDE